MPNRMRVLVADDDPLLLAMYAEIVSSLGYVPLCTATGTEAWRVLEQDPPPLVILDLLMPDLGGLELCRRLRERERALAPQLYGESGRPEFIGSAAWQSVIGNAPFPPPAFVLVITARDDGDVLSEVLDAGADDFLAKPVSADQLAARLTIAMRQIEQRQAQQHAEYALARAQWLAGIGETSLALQHEINNPLTAIMGHAALLATEEYPPHEEREFIRIVLEQAHRIGEVVRRLASLKDPRTVPYVLGARMLDLSPDPPIDPDNPPGPTCQWPSVLPRYLLTVNGPDDDGN